MRQRLALLTLVVAVSCMACSSATAYTGNHPKMQIRLQWVDQVDLQTLRQIQDLDVMKYVPGEEIILVSNDDQIERLEALGFEVEIQIPDMEEHYASQRAGGDRNFGDFYTYSEMAAYLDQFSAAYPEILSEKFSIGTTWEGNTIWAVKLSDNVGVDEPDEPDVLMDALHHAREPMGVNILIETIRHLCENYGTDPEVTFLVDNRETYFVPVVNPDGYLYNESTYPNGGGMWRKNRRDNEGSSCYGVDPNRNYPYMWDHGGISYDPCNDVYLGPEPGSELEVQTMMNFIIDHEFITHDTYHAVAGVILIPWSWTGTDCPDRDLYIEYCTALDGGAGYPIGECGEMLGYSCSGTTFDWTYGDTTTKPRVWSICTEVNGSGFWPNDSEIPGLVAENIPKNIYLMKAAGIYLTLLDLTMSGGNGDGKPDPGETLDVVLSVRNDAIVTDATNAAVVLRSDDPYVQMITAEATMGNIAARETGDNTGQPVSFFVDPACPAGHNLTLSVLVTADGYEMEFVREYTVGDMPVILADDMESGQGDWTHEVVTGGFADEWHMSTQRNHTGGGDTSWKFGSTGAGDYADLADGALTTPVMQLGSVTRISFWHWMDAEDSSYYTGRAYDGGLIEMTVGGAPWVQIIPDEGYTHTIREGSQPGPFAEDTPVYSGTFSWTEGTISLEGVTGEARFRFRFGSDGNSGGEGWYVDDLMISGLSTENTAPSAPALVSPTDGELVHTSTPLLVVQNATDPDPGTTLTYGYQVFADELLTSLVTSADGVAEGASETSWYVSPPLADGTYYWRAYADDGEERGQCMAAASFTVEGSQGIAENQLAVGLRLMGAAPNPGPGATTLRFELGQGGIVRARLFDLQGRQIRALESLLPAGVQGLPWDGRDQNGVSVPAGMYLYKVSDLSGQQEGRLLLVR